MRKALLTLFFLLSCSILLGVAYAGQVTIGSNDHFGVDVPPGVYSNVTRINGVWYFDGMTYPPTSSPTPTPTANPGGGGGGSTRGGGGYAPTFDIKIVSCTCSGENGSVSATLTNMAQAQEFTINLIVKDSAGNTVYSASQSKYMASGASAPLVWSFPAPTSSGVYTVYLNVNGLSTNGNQASTSFTVGGQNNNFGIAYLVLIGGLVVAVYILLGGKKKR